MQTDSPLISLETRSAQWRSRLSMAALITATVLLLCNALLISPPPAPTYPGAIEWSPQSWLKQIVDAQSLFGALQTMRGVEVKDVAFHFATVLLLLLLGARALVSGMLPPDRRTARGAWFSAEVLLVGWVLCSALSAIWSGDAELALGQATLFGISVAWAVSLSWTLEGRDVPRLIWCYVVVAAICGAMCVWYYYERNPYHRPGFPIGNPSSLAGLTIPAFLICATILVGGLIGWLRGPEPISPLWMGGALLGAIPLGYTLWLSSSRASLVGGILGVAGVLFLTLTRRARMVILFSLGALALAGVWRLSATMEDVAMARGATVRFRLYTWQYAAELWSRRPISGNGAGCFPRGASGLSASHQKIDPAAFLGEKIAHAHNEFFEVLAEIGLIGGLTFVGAFVATIVAASGMLQSNYSRQRYLLMLGLVAGLLAMLGDSLFGVGLRLPGGPPVFFTLLGLVWAQSRSVSRQHGPQSVTESWLQRMPLRRFGLAAFALAAAGGTAWAGWQNLRGLRAEVDSMVAITEGRFADARDATDLAASHLLDPIRILLARERRLFALSYEGESLAEQALDSIYRDRTPDADQIRSALRANERTYQAAADFHRRTPGFGRAAALAGRAGDMIAHMLAAHAPENAQAWRVKAWQAWQVQRLFRPYDRGILLALLGFPLSVGDQVGLLRDALRAGSPDEDWMTALGKTSRVPGFEEALTGLIDTVAPYTAESDRDAIMLSAAPEMYRLRAIWRHNQGRSAEAAADAARAVSLYRPLRSRVPELESVALAERAEYELHAQDGDATMSIEIAREALARLPVVQAQKYAQMAEPFRVRLVRYLISAGRAEEAFAVLPDITADEAGQRQILVQCYEQLLNTFGWKSTAPPLTPWIDPLLRLDPENDSGWYWRATQVRALGPEAIAAFRAAIPENMPEAVQLAIDAGLAPPASSQPRRQKPATSQPAEPG